MRRHSISNKCLFLGGEEDGNLVGPIAGGGGGVLVVVLLVAGALKKKDKVKGKYFSTNVKCQSFTNQEAVLMN